MSQVRKTELLETIRLPAPKTKRAFSVEEAIQRRKSRRDYARKGLTLEELSQMLWCTLGTTLGRHKASPSAGACYPLDVHVVIGKDAVTSVPAGVYEYEPVPHELKLRLAGDVREELCEAAWGQDFIAAAPVTMAFVAEFERTTQRYGERGLRYVFMDVGHMGQNIYLQAEALGLGTVAVGAFQDERVSSVLKLPSHLKPVYLMPVGHPS